jgi:glycosyltransferase involved in cell wall biosynthesis
MKIAFAAIADPQDKRVWSGTVFHLYQALERAGHEMIPIGNLKNPYGQLLKLVRKVVRVTTGKRYLGETEPLVLKSYARQIARRLRGLDYDVLLACHSQAVSELKIGKPMAFFADATFAAMDGYYESHSNLSARDIKTMNLMEARALKRCSAAFYASDWASGSAVRDYAALPAKVHTVPFGANMECPRTDADVKQLIRSKERDRCHLLFVGLEWARKGGDFAVQVARQMNANGVATTLHVVGCEPECPAEPFMKVYGRIDKKTDDGKALFDGLFGGAHFLIVPSRTECYGVVFCEAASFGLPSIATRTGGIPTAVKDGENGFLVELDSDPNACAEKAQGLFEDEGGYIELSRRTFARYKSTLCWEAAARSVGDVLQDLAKRSF